MVIVCMDLHISNMYAFPGALMATCLHPIRIQSRIEALSMTPFMQARNVVTDKRRSRAHRIPSGPTHVEEVLVADAPASAEGGGTWGRLTRGGPGAQTDLERHIHPLVCVHIDCIHAAWL